LALFGREELGKYILLRDAFEQVAAGGNVDFEQLKKKLLYHTAKQTSSIFHIAQQFSNDHPIAQAILARMDHDPGSEEYEEAQRLIDESAERRKEELPDSRHQLRLSTLYVGPNSDGSGWERPQDQAGEDARHEVWDAVNDYSLVYDRLIRGNEGPLPSKIRAAFLAWSNHPTIPEPVRPKSRITSGATSG